MSRTPIADHALLSDRHSAALVTVDGSVDWLCFPRFDSPAVFARLLDDDAGHFSIRPAGPAASRRRYLDDTMVLETTLTTAAGTIVVTDALAVGPANHGHALGVDAPHCLIRRVTCTHGEVEVDIVYAPRPEYGLIHPLLSMVDGGVTARGGAEWLVLTTPVPLTLTAATATGSPLLAAGQTIHLGLHRSTLGGDRARVWSQDELATRLDATVAAWQQLPAGLQPHRAHQRGVRDRRGAAAGGHPRRPDLTDPQRQGRPGTGRTRTGDREPPAARTHTGCDQAGRVPIDLRARRRPGQPAAAGSCSPAPSRAPCW